MRERRDGPPWLGHGVQAVNIDDIEPKLSAEPLRHRRDNETWLEWAVESYAHTLAELEMPIEAWESHFGIRHPGSGYTNALKAQKSRLGDEITTCLVRLAAQRAKYGKPGFMPPSGRT